MPEPPSHAARKERETAGVPRARGARNPASAEAVCAPGARGRHGRTRASESAADSSLRRRAVRLAVLPAAFVALVGAVLVACVLARGDGPLGDVLDVPGTDGLLLWGVLGAGALLVCGILVAASHLASADARDTAERYAALRRVTARSRAEVGVLLHGLEQGEEPRPRVRAPLTEPSASADALELLTYELAVTHRAAEDSLSEAAALARSSAGGREEQVEVFVNLSRRLQSLVHRQIGQLDELENEVEDPELLKGLFHVDHLATRIRRHAENLAVLGGTVSRRQWSRPVSATEVLRSATAEVEQYSRVRLVPPVEGTLRGHVVADVIHLLAELVENATVFSAPATSVLLRAQHVTSGLAIEVEDRGLGMTPAEQDRMNALLSDPDRVDVGELLQDGRIGLFVVSALARRHGIVVQLQNNIYGGVQAVLVLPHALLGGEDASAPEASAAPGAADPAGRAAAAAAELSRTREPEPAGPQRAEPPEHAAHFTPAPPEDGDPPPLPRRRPPEAEAAPGPAAPAAEPSPVPGQREAGGGAERPRLPRRRRQQNLAPGLVGEPLAPRPPLDDGAGHDPNLMASFRRGADLAHETTEEDPDDGAPAPCPEDGDPFRAPDLTRPGP